MRLGECEDSEKQVTQDVGAAAFFLSSLIKEERSYLLIFSMSHLPLTHINSPPHPHSRHQGFPPLFLTQIFKLWSFLPAALAFQCFSVPWTKALAED